MAPVVYFAELVYELFWQTNMYRKLDLCPDQPGRNQMYQSYRVAKGGFFLESEIRFSNLPISQKSYSKKLS